MVAVRELLCAVMALGACSADGRAMDPGMDPMVDAAATIHDAIPPPDAPIDVAVARGEQWVAAMVPYCQAINHAPDSDTACSPTCTRPDMPQWDPYRSDCSGFVSWAWELPSDGGGRVTSEFAPFQNDISHVIQAMDLQPGDAINRTEVGHMMLFKEWVTPGSRATFMEEPGCSFSQPYAREFTSDVTIAGEMITVGDRGTYTAIRDDMP